MKSAIKFIEDMNRDAFWSVNMTSFERKVFDMLKVTNDQVWADFYMEYGAERVYEAADSLVEKGFAGIYQGAYYQK